MDFEQDTARAPFRPTARTWPTRLIGSGIVLLCLLMLMSLISYRIDEMGWAFLNPAGAEKAAATPCTNLLGVPGLYISGLLYSLLGAAAIYTVLLCSIVGSGMLLWPAHRRLGQWISLVIMVILACGVLAVQDMVLEDRASAMALRGPGGGLGYLVGTCVTEALMGKMYALCVLLAAHALALIYFARLTPGMIVFGVWDDLRLLWKTWCERRRRKQEEKARRAAEWKNSIREQSPADKPATGSILTSRPVAQPPQSVPVRPPLRQIQLPISVPEPQVQQPHPQGAPLPQREPIPVRESLPTRNPLPPRDSIPQPLQPLPQRNIQPVPQRPADPLPHLPQRSAPAPQAPLPPRQRTTIPQPSMPQQPQRPLPVRSAAEPRIREPQTLRPADPRTIRSQGDNLLDLMDDVEQDIERSSFTGEAPRTAAVPREHTIINERLQREANRFMGKGEEAPNPAPAATPAPVETPAVAIEDDGYPLPPYDLLNYTPPSPEVAMAAEAEALEVQQCLIDTFSNFNIAVEPGEITRGPSLTRYEFYPPKGLRLSRIANLGNDLMLATQTKSVNILAPIPGKNTVGVELENATKESVYLRELLESPAFHNPKLKIPVALGKNVYGEPVIGDLAAMPHALVAGTTGSGKSVCINSMILSMLYKFKPDELRLVLVDPKVVEMQPYRKLPHLACPVVTNPARVIGALRWAVNEMEHRYSMFSKIGVRNFEDFNNRPEGYMPEPEEDESPEQDLPIINSAAIEAMMSDIERSAGEEIPEEDMMQREMDFESDNEIPAKLPYIVIIIDELADLMMVVKEDLENYIARLTQKARAAGIHLVAATQTPRSNVVTGLIKANIPCRIALKVASPLDSRIILDTNGAENLLGKGDLLFLPPGGITKLTRAQGAWVSDAEIASIIKFCASHAKQKFDQNVTAEMNNADGSGPGGPGSDGENGRLVGSKGGNDEDDELYTRCVNLVVTERKASTSLLQRRFSIGYGRAAKIMDMMEARGVISSPQGATRAREVLVEAPE